ncbi:unnamed protein product [Arctogadus glacialis]
MEGYPVFKDLSYLVYKAVYKAVMVGYPVFKDLSYLVYKAVYRAVMEWVELRVGAASYFRPNCSSQPDLQQCCQPKGQQLHLVVVKINYTLINSHVQVYTKPVLHLSGAFSDRTSFL